MGGGGGGGGGASQGYAHVTNVHSVTLAHHIKDICSIRAGDTRTKSRVYMYVTTDTGYFKLIVGS